MGAINGMLCGHLKASVINFEVSDQSQEEGTPRYSSTFRIRVSFQDHTNVFSRLLIYLDFVKSHILLKYKCLVSGVRYSHERSAEEGQIVKLLFKLAMEEVNDGDTLPTICCFALFDCFHIKHGKLCLKGLDSISKTFSSVLYLLQEGIVACASMLVNNGHIVEAERMIKFTQKQAAINQVSPWIRNVKELQSRIPKSSTTLIDEQHSISYMSLHVTSEHYSKLIPSMLNKMCSIFSLLFETDTWKAFFDLSYNININSH
jgi:hypothetical protein